MSSPAASHDDIPMGRIYAQVIVLEIAVLIGRWFLQQYFSR